MTSFRGLGAQEQAALWQAYAADRRPRIKTGWPALDADLPLGGLRPGSLVAIAGRTHTRKTALALNLCANMLKADVPVLWVGLDEDTAMYAVKLASVFTGTPHTELELTDPLESYTSQAHRLVMTQGYRPDNDQLAAVLSIADVDTDLRPRVVFIDYLQLLYRDRYAGGDVSRVPRLFEDLKVWAGEEEVVVFVLHQVGRQDEGAAHKRFHGHKPGTLESMKFGGEEAVDALLFTFRPELDPFGNMTEDDARSSVEKFDLEAWQEAVDRVHAEENVTRVQLLKNRQGTRLNLQGTRLRSVGESQKMRPADESVGEDGLRVVEARL